ncbi:unnamed protein product [Mucor hiemalis]
MEPPRLEKLQSYAERRQHQIYGKHYSSSTTSLPHTSSSASLSNRSSTYAPNIEKQLHSLVIADGDTQQERDEVLEQAFQEMDFDKRHHHFMTPSLDHGFVSNTSLSLLGEDIQHFDNHNEPMSQRAIRMESNDPFVKAMGLRKNSTENLPTKNSLEKRHTLSLGQVDRLLHSDRSESGSVKFSVENGNRVKNEYNPYKRSQGLSVKEAQEISKWIPEHSEWEDDWVEGTRGESSNPFKSPHDSNNDVPLLLIPTLPMEKNLPGNQHA